MKNTKNHQGCTQHFEHNATTDIKRGRERERRRERNTASERVRADVLMQHRKMSGLGGDVKSKGEVKTRKDYVHDD